MQSAMAGTVDEVIRVAEAEGIDADIVRADNLVVATNAAQMDRLADDYRSMRDWEVPAEKVALLSAREAAERVGSRAFRVASSCAEWRGCSRRSLRGGSPSLSSGWA